MAVPAAGAVTGVTIVDGGSGFSPTGLVSFNSKHPSEAEALYTFNVETTMEPTDTLELQFKASANNCIIQDNVLSTISNSTSSTYGAGITSQSLSTNVGGTVSVIGITTNIILQSLRGELGQWDFIKGLMTMFNLVSIPDEVNPNNIKFEPYGDVFLNNSDSQQLDWTDKVDVTQMKLTPLTNLNKKTIFKFVEDDDDYAFNVYKRAVEGHLYGSRTFDASTSSGGLDTIFEGTKEWKGKNDEKVF